MADFQQQANCAQRIGDEFSSVVTADRRTFLSGAGAFGAVAALPAFAAGNPRRAWDAAMAYPAFSEIPSHDYSAPYVRNDLCGPQWKRGDLIMADHRSKGGAGGYVWAKAFGECPQVMPFEMAIMAGMKVLGEIVGYYRLGLGDA